MDGFHLLVYDAATGAAVTAQDLTAIVDPIFTQRNGHITLTDDLKLIGAHATAVALTRASIRTPTWNAQTIFNIDPIQLGITNPSPPRVMDLWDYKPTIPQDEEVQIQVADTQAAGETITAALFIGTPGWNRNVPKGMGPMSMFCARVTATGALLARSFSALLALTFEQGLRAGIYAVVGSHWTVPSALYHRMQFPRSTLYNGRAMRPGDLVSQAIGDQPWAANSFRNSPWGVWGKFHTYELPQVEFYSPVAVGSATYEGRLFLVKLSETSDPSFLSS